MSILDTAGEATAAAHLQMASDTLARATPVEPDERVLSHRGDGDPSIVRAMGGALAIIAALMERRGPTSVAEISDMLATYAAVTAETASDEGLIPAYWAATLRDASQAQDGKARRRKRVEKDTENRSRFCACRGRRTPHLRHGCGDFCRGWLPRA